MDVSSPSSTLNSPNTEQCKSQAAMALKQQLVLAEGLHPRRLAELVIEVMQLKMNSCKSRKSRNILQKASQILCCEDDYVWSTNKYRSGICQTQSYDDLLLEIHSKKPNVANARTQTNAKLSKEKDCQTDPKLNCGKYCQTDSEIPKDYQTQHTQTPLIHLVPVKDAVNAGLIVTGESLKRRSPEQMPDSTAQVLVTQVIPPVKRRRRNSNERRKRSGSTEDNQTIAKSICDIGDRPNSNKVKNRSKQYAVLPIPLERADNDCVPADPRLLSTEQIATIRKQRAKIWSHRMGIEETDSLRGSSSVDQIKSPLGPQTPPYSNENDEDYVEDDTWSNCSETLLVIKEGPVYTTQEHETDDDLDTKSSNHMRPQKIDMLSRPTSPKQINGEADVAQPVNLVTKKNELLEDILSEESHSTSYTPPLPGTELEKKTAKTGPDCNTTKTDAKEAVPKPPRAFEAVGVNPTSVKQDNQTAIQQVPVAKLKKDLNTTTEQPKEPVTGQCLNYNSKTVPSIAEPIQVNTPFGDGSKISQPVAIPAPQTLPRTTESQIMAPPVGVDQLGFTIQNSKPSMYSFRIGNSRPKHIPVQNPPQSPNYQHRPSMMWPSYQTNSYLQVKQALDPNTANHNNPYHVQDPKMVVSYPTIHIQDPVYEPMNQHPNYYSEQSAIQRQYQTEPQKYPSPMQDVNHHHYQLTNALFHERYISQMYQAGVALSKSPNHLSSPPLPKTAPPLPNSPPPALDPRPPLPTGHPVLEFPNQPSPPGVGSGRHSVPVGLYGQNLSVPHAHTHVNYNKFSKMQNKQKLVSYNQQMQINDENVLWYDGMPASINRKQTTSVPNVRRPTSVGARVEDHVMQIQDMDLC